MNIIGIIPARFGSSRFEGKPLVDICGMSMIERVYRRCLISKMLSDVVVATDDERIFNHVIQFGGKVVLTSKTHSTGTERCNEALDILQKKAPVFIDGVINIQGDEPLINPLQIDALATLLAQDGVEISTLMKKISDKTELFNENVVKVVVNQFSKALYFSRNPIPFCRSVAPENWLSKATFFKHVGIYAYRTNVLTQLVNLGTTMLESSESLEQLRWLWNGYSIYVNETEFESVAIDTPDDLERMLKNYF